MNDELVAAAIKKLETAEAERKALSEHAHPYSLAQADKAIARAQSTLEWLKQYASGDETWRR